MKIQAFSKNGQMALIGEEGVKGEWYTFSEKVAQFIKKFKVGDDIEIKSEGEGNNKILVYITNKGASTGGKGAYQASTSTYKKPYTKPYTPSGGGSTYSKSPEDKEQIKRLSIFGSVCDAVNTLQGMVDVNNIGDVIENLYDRFYAKISS